MMSIPERKDVNFADTWALTDLYGSDAEWQEDFQWNQDYLNYVKGYQGRLGESAQLLYNWLQLGDEMSRIFERLAVYAFRRADEDTRAAKPQEMCAQLTNFMTQLNTATAFETNEILAISDEKLEQFYQDVPALESYRRHLDEIRRRRAHILSPAEERLLAMAGELSDNPDNIFSMLNDADLTFPDAIDAQGAAHHVTHGSYIPMMYGADRTLRKSAFESLYGVYERHKNTLAATLAAQAKQLWFFAQARNYPSALAAALDRTEVPESVYHSLIDAVRENLPKLHRYTSLRKKLLGVEELHFYDLYANMVGDVEMKFTFAEAKELVLKALAPLSENYLNGLRAGFEGRWIDVYENVGKRSGAYSSGARPHPFVLLNFQGTLNDVFTLAHEMGHAMHSEMSNVNQPVVYSDYVIFVAEVASTCNEALLMEYLLNHTTDKREKAYLINYFLEQFRTTLYRQTMFAEFELQINELAQQGQGITADRCCEIYRKLNEDYFGKDIVVDDQIALEWARIPHFYYNYYVYQYATGYAAAIAISRRILKEGQPAVDDYFKFLSGGCSMPPIELLKLAGVDLSTPAPIHQALELFDQLIDQLDELLAE